MKKIILLSILFSYPLLSMQAPPSSEHSKPPLPTLTTPETRQERTANPLTRFALALSGRRKAHDGPHLTLPSDEEGSIITTTTTSCTKMSTIEIQSRITVTGNYSIRKFKEELKKIAAQCCHQEKTIAPLMYNNEDVIADQFTSATYTEDKYELRCNFRARFPSKEVYQTWIDYKNYIPYK